MAEIVRLETQATAIQEVLCETPSYRAMVGAMDAAQLMPDSGILWITADAGCGKTTAARSFARTRPGARYVCLSRGAKSLRAVIDRLGEGLPGYAASGLGVGPAHRALVAALRRVADDSEDASGMHVTACLLVDEIQFASDEVLHTLRGLWDELNADGPALAMVWLGNEDARAQLGRDDRGTFQPIYTRRGEWLNFDRASAADLEAYCRGNGVGRAELIRYLEKACLAEGLRGVRQTLLRARLRAAGEGRALKLEDLKAAVAMRRKPGG